MLKESVTYKDYIRLCLTEITGTEEEFLKFKEGVEYIYEESKKFNYKHKPLDILPWAVVEGFKWLPKMSLSELDLLKGVGCLLCDNYSIDEELIFKENYFEKNKIEYIDKFQDKTLAWLWSAKNYYFSETEKLQQKEYDTLNTKYTAIELNAGAKRMEDFGVLNSIDFIIEKYAISPVILTNSEILTPTYIALQIPYREVFTVLHMRKVSGEISSAIHELNMTQHEP